MAPDKSIQVDEGDGLEYWEMPASSLAAWEKWKEQRALRLAEQHKQWLILEKLRIAASKMLPEIAKRDGMLCQHCGATQKLTVDHIIPRSRGGTNDLGNLQLLCRACNSRKGAR